MESCEQASWKMHSSDVSGGLRLAYCSAAKAGRNATKNQCQVGTLSCSREHWQGAFAGERCGGWTAAVREHEARQSFVEIPRNRHKEAHDVVKLAAFHMGEHMSPTNTGRENGCRELAIANLGSGRSASGD